MSIMVFFMFLRIPNIFKTLMCILCLLFYGLIIFGTLGTKEDLQNPRTFFSVIRLHFLEYWSAFILEWKFWLWALEFW